jgi:cell division septation protein DedD
MSRQRRERKGSTPASGVELELGGMSLVLVGVIVLALCAISFWLGRQSVPAPPPATADVASPEGAPVVEGGDVEQELTFFDRLEAAPDLSAQGDERTVLPPQEEKEPASPPAREASQQQEPPRQEQKKNAAGQALPVATGGTFQVQVLATTEKEAADAMVARLKARGFPARLTSGDFKGQQVFRVRVGGYPDEAAAQQVAHAIRQQEGLQTWVTR